MFKSVLVLVFGLRVSNNRRHEHIPPALERQHQIVGLLGFLLSQGTPAVGPLQTLVESELFSSVHASS